MALLAVTGPGDIPEMAIISVNSCVVIHPCCETSDSITGIMAYPPPKDTKPIIKKVLNNSHNSIIPSHAFLKIS
jgi:hypothetical protein